MKYMAFPISILCLAVWEDIGNAKPFATTEFCQIYPDSPACRTGQVNCQYCHTTPPTLNSYGACIKKQVQGDLETDFVNAVGDAADDDCDGDGSSNLEEILAGTAPSQKSSRPTPTPKDPSQMSCAERDSLSSWKLCEYDFVFAFKRVYLDFCGYSPGFAQYQAFRRLNAEAQRAQLHVTLDECMQTAHWRGPDGVVWSLGHKKISPLQTIKSGANQGSIPLGDYDDDYHLFVYHHLDDHDVRGLLTAQYYVERDGLTYTSVDNIDVHPDAGGVPGLLAELFNDKQQFVPPERRAGMLTTLWFAVNNTMFTSIPRTTAAQAMRAHLGIDIAKSQGLVVPNDPNFELIDYDNKGITDPACAFCHEVLDPAAYPFGKYNGLSFNVPGNRPVDIGSIFDPESDSDMNIPGFIPDFLVQAFLNRSKTLVPGMYKASRMQVLAEMNAATEPDLGAIPERGYLFGQPVRNLTEWGQVAANSNQFAQATVMDYWRLFITLEVESAQKKEFDHLWQSLKAEDQYSVRAMLHRLIDMEAYGAP